MIAVIATIAIVSNVNAQQTVVIQNSEEAKKTVGTDGSFYINGISSKEDIGGVEARVTTNSWVSGAYFYVRLINYHDFKVTVLYQAGSAKVTGSVVLEPGEKKDVYYGQATVDVNGVLPPEMFSVFTITRKL